MGWRLHILDEVITDEILAKASRGWNVDALPTLIHSLVALSVMVAILFI